jgi:hypothetical protein
LFECAFIPQTDADDSKDVLICEDVNYSPENDRGDVNNADKQWGKCPILVPVVHLLKMIQQ